MGREVNDLYRTGEIAGLIYMAIVKENATRGMYWTVAVKERLLTNPGEYRNYFSQTETLLPDLEMRFNALNEADFRFVEVIQPVGSIQFLKGFSHEVAVVTRAFELCELRKRTGMRRKEFADALKIGAKSLRDFERLIKPVPHAILEWARAVSHG